MVETTSDPNFGLQIHHAFLQWHLDLEEKKMKVWEEISNLSFYSGISILISAPTLKTYKHLLLASFPRRMRHVILMVPREISGVSGMHFLESTHW